MGFPQINPYVRIALDNWQESGWKIPMRVIFDYEIMLVKNGELEVVVDGTLYHGLPGDIFVFRPSHPHSIRSVGTDSVRQPHVHFDLVEDRLSPYVYICFDNMDRIPESDYQLFR